MSQPKTLLAGPALGFSKTVSVPVRLPLNTDGAVQPARSVGRTGRMGRCGRGIRGGCPPELRSSGLSGTHPGTPHPVPRPPTAIHALHCHRRRGYSPHSRMTWYVLDLISWFLARFPRAPFRSSSFTGGRFFLMGAS